MRRELRRVSDEIGRRLGTVEPVSSAELMKLLEELDDYRSDMLAWMQDYEIIVCPTARVPCHTSRDVELRRHLPGVQPHVGI